METKDHHEKQIYTLLQSKLEKGIVQQTTFFNSDGFQEYTLKETTLCKQFALKLSPSSTNAFVYFLAKGKFFF